MNSLDEMIVLQFLIFSIQLAALYPLRLQSQKLSNFSSNYQIDPTQFIISTSQPSLISLSQFSSVLTWPQNSTVNGPVEKLSPDIVSQYILPVGSQFTHLVYDSRRSILYGGATNRIIQFNKNLSVLNNISTGPKLDSPQCHAGGCTPTISSDIETIETNNYNKVLIINKLGDRLIACGSVYQGSCELYNLNNFPDDVQQISVPLAANDQNSSTYAFIGPSKYSQWKKEDILYVGTTFTNVGSDYRHDVPAISSRKLDDLNYAEFSIMQSNLYIDVKYRDHFIVDYIYGFNSSDYAYFAVVQKKSHLAAEENGYITRLARICVNDPNYDSYTEVTIQCLGPDNTDYNILRDAKLTTANHRLSQQMNIKKDDILLITVFSPAKEVSNEPQAKSAMCVYSLKEIEEIFTENIHMCFNGSIKDRNLGYISGTINDGKCPDVGSMGNFLNLYSLLLFFL